MRKKPEYGLGRSFAANTPAARWPLATVMNGKRGLGGKALMKLFPLHRACALAQVKDTPLRAAEFFIARPFLRI
jgi:hypothetical protein